MVESRVERRGEVGESGVGDSLHGRLGWVAECLERERESTVQRIQRTRAVQAGVEARSEVRHNKLTSV